MAREINLVPDVKGEMIKALKLRNFILFICIIVASASAGVSIFAAVVAFGQQAIVDSNKTVIDSLSDKLYDYNELEEFLTIKDQLGNLNALSNNKKLLSRTFNLLSSMIPAGENSDSITISELNIDFKSESPTISFEAQANDKTPPDENDYNVLDSFKKSMPFLRYDYGNYVDKKGAVIPAYCIIESGDDGATFYDTEKSSYYALWLITGDGCNPSYQSATESDDQSNSETSSDSETNSEPDTQNVSDPTEGYTTETYDDQTVVRIWRTPQFKDWFKNEAVEGEPYMSLDGEISGVAHFVSECISYTGVRNEQSGTIEWSSLNERCLSVPTGIDGIQISESSYGLNTNGELVVRFAASITLDPGIFSFNNKHVLAFGPTGRHNVTDSFRQLQNIFEQRATDCTEDDEACNKAKGEENNG